MHNATRFERVGLVHLTIITLAKLLKPVEQFNSIEKQTALRINEKMSLMDSLIELGT